MAEPRLKVKYRDEIIASLQKKFDFSSSMRVPRVEKVVINQGLGRAVADKKIIDTGIEEMTMIAGQKAVSTLSKNSISNFKLRDGMPIGVMVTLRGQRMYEFLDRLISIALPRVRDFRGVKEKGFDGRGNYTLGVKEQIIFPEITLDKIKNIEGMNITIVTTAENDEEGEALLSAIGMPFTNKNAKV